MEGLNVIYERWVLYLLSLPKYMEEKVLFFLPSSLHLVRGAAGLHLDTKAFFTVN